MKRLFVIGLMLLMPATFAVEVMQWQRLPLPVQLSVGHERVVFVDRNVRVGTPASLQGKLRVQSVAGAVYLKALDAIEPTRIQLQDKQSGEIVLLDIGTVQDSIELEPIKIVTSGAAMAATDQPETPTQPAPPPAQTPVPATLIRYVAQMMYAPLRTVEPLTGVRQMPIRIKGELSTLMPTLNVKTHVLGAWSVSPWTVTAVRITNPESQRLVMDPRLLQGDFYAATFQHTYLGASGTPEDTTTVYLVTRDKGLESALIPMPQEAINEQ